MITSRREILEDVVSIRGSVDSFDRGSPCVHFSYRIYSRPFCCETRFSLQCLEKAYVCWWCPLFNTWHYEKALLSFSWSILSECTTTWVFLFVSFCIASFLVVMLSWYCILWSTRPVHSDMQTVKQMHQISYLGEIRDWLGMQRQN